jgi:hypothetical protein
MAVGMGLLKDRNGTWIVRRKVPQRLREPVARVLDVSKQQQVWLQKSTGTKHKAEATRLAPAIMAEFAKTLNEAEGLLAQLPLRTTLTQQEIDRIAEWHYATVLATDEAFIVEGATEEEAFNRSIADQLTEAGVEFGVAHPLGPSPAFGLSDRQLAQRADHLDDWLPIMRGALARGDISMVSETMTELLDRAQLNLDPQSAAYRKLGLAVLRADVRAWEAVERRAKGEPIETPVVEELTAPKGSSAPMGSKREPNLQVGFEGWKKEGGRSSSTVSEYQRALDLFTQLHGNLPVAEIRKQHALQFRQALQEVPRGKSKTLAKLTLPELAETSPYSLIHSDRILPTLPREQGAGTPGEPVSKPRRKAQRRERSETFAEKGAVPVTPGGVGFPP